MNFRTGAVVLLVTLSGGLLSEGRGQFVFVARSGFIDDMGDSNFTNDTIGAGGAIFKFDTAGNYIDHYSSLTYGGLGGMALGPDNRIYIHAAGQVGSGDTNGAILSYDPDNLTDEIVVVSDLKGTFPGGPPGQAKPDWSRGFGPLGFNSDGQIVTSNFSTPSYAWRVDINGTPIDETPFITTGTAAGPFFDPALGNPYPLGRFLSRSGKLIVPSPFPDGVSMYQEVDGSLIVGTEQAIDQGMPGDPTSIQFGPDLNNDGEQDLYVMRFSVAAPAGNQVRVVSGKEIFDGTFPAGQPPLLTTDFTNNVTDSFAGDDDLLQGASGAIELLPDGKLLIGILPNQQSATIPTNAKFCGVKQFDPATRTMSVFHQFTCLQQHVNGSLTNTFFGSPTGLLYMPETATYNPADFDQNGVVDPGDFAILAGNWLMSGSFSAGDANGDGFVNPADFAILAGNWLFGVGEVPHGMGFVPEPSTLVLLGWSILLMVSQLRRHC